MFQLWPLICHCLVCFFIRAFQSHISFKAQTVGLGQTFTGDWEEALTNSVQQKHSHDGSFWEAFPRAAAANLGHALISFTWDAGCEACCAMWILFCISECLLLGSGNEFGSASKKWWWVCVTASGWKSLSNGGIWRRGNASAHPRSHVEGGKICFHRVRQRCWPRSAVVGFTHCWLRRQQLSRKQPVQHQHVSTSLPGWWMENLEVLAAWWLDWELLPASHPLPLYNYY